MGGVEGQGGGAETGVGGVLMWCLAWAGRERGGGSGTHEPVVVGEAVCTRDGAVHGE